MGATRIGRLDVADLGLGKVGRSRIQDIVKQGFGRRRMAPQLWLTAFLCGSVVVFEQFHTLAFQAPMLRAVIETEITLCSLAGSWLFGLSFWHNRQLRNLLLAGALLQLGVIDFVSYVVPASVHLAYSGGLTAASMLGTLFMANAMLVAAGLGDDRKLTPGVKPVALMIAASVVGAGIAELGGILLRFSLMSRSATIGQGFEEATDHPIGLALALAAAALVVAAALRTATNDRASGDGITLLLPAAMICFAAARLNYVVLPTAGVGWVTAREGLRVIAFGLFFAAALRQEASMRRTVAREAAAAERHRIARDLHDGLAQDLAFIAAHGDRIAQEAGDDHPLAIAARRALAVSRGAIADLSAAEAPTATAALHQVADELEVRFGVRVTIEADDTVLRPDARDDVVRIVREAIVNAAKAQAHTIVVSLARTGEYCVLRIQDDGAGIGSGLDTRPGFGLRAMRERASSLGGDLTARPGRRGGTELEVVFP